MLTLQDASLDWALQHAINHGDTDVLPRPFEYDAIQYDWANVKKYLLQQDILKWQVRPTRIIFAPKAKYGFRVITQLDPLDFLVFTAILREIGTDIEQERLSTSEQKIFSYRFDPDSNGRFFNQNIGYAQFQEQTKSIIDWDYELTHVVVADIADFYSRIYLHRLENSLGSAVTSKVSHVKSIMNLLSGWNGTESFGIPIGSASSRMLAEITISDVDEALLANRVNFVRFNDDYRIFANSYEEAYRHLAFLADILYKNHGLTLQSKKTVILTKEEFKRRFLSTLEEKEIISLRETFSLLLNNTGLNFYSKIEYNELNSEQQKIIDSLNLRQILLEEVNSQSEPDFGIVKFVLRRLGQLSDSSAIDTVLDNLNSLYPVFPDIIKYISSVRTLSTQERTEIGERILNLVDDSIISELEYHRIWALDLFTHSIEWGNGDKFFQLLGNAREVHSKRKLILAMGRAKQRHWFQSQWRSLFNEPHWSRRALIAGASCMPADARKHWYRSIEPRLDELEKAVMRWARNNPFAM